MVDALDASEILNFFVCNHTKDNGQSVAKYLSSSAKKSPESSQKYAEDE